MSKVSRTNQVLYFSRLCLDQAEQETDSQKKRQLEESALFHLYNAVTSFSGELVAQYALAPFLGLDELFGRNGLPSELIELSLLHADTNSWLGSIVVQYQRVLQAGLESGAVSGGLIFSQSDYAGLFRNWLIELEKSIQRMREHYQEY
ncbi:MAG: DUF6586 family protein [Bermanella sp.]